MNLITFIPDLKPKIKPAPQIKIVSNEINDDFIGSIQLLPDYSWMYFQKYVEDIYDYLRDKIPPTMTDYILKITIVTVYSLSVILIIRLIFPLPTVLLISLTAISIYNRQGLIITSYMAWDLFRSRTGRNKPNPILQTFTPTTNVCITNGLSGVLFVWMYVILGSIATGAIRSEAIYLVISTLTAMLLATTRIFPNTGLSCNL